VNRRRVVATFAVAALLGCGGGEVRFDMNSPPAWLQRLERSSRGRAVRPDEVRGNCFEPFGGGCTAGIARSPSIFRTATLRLTGGLEARLTYTPAEGTPVSMMIDRSGDAKLRVRKSGGSLAVDGCVSPGQGCALALVTER
jgi:hypothetical protein